MKITIEVSDWFQASPLGIHDDSHKMGNPPVDNPFVRHCYGRGCNYTERRRPLSPTL